MVIRSKFLKLSTLCIIGTVVFLVNKSEPGQDGMGQKVKSYVKDTKDDLFGGGDSNNEDLVQSSKDGSSEFVNAANDGALRESGNERLKMDSGESNKIDNKIPDIKGITGRTVNLDLYKDVVISKSKEYLNIRKGPGKNYDIIGKLPGGAAGYVKSSKNVDGQTWYYIESGDVKGYVLGEFLYTGDEALAMVPKVGRYVIKVTCDTLNVREKPSKSSTVLFQISKGEELEVEGVENGWVEVSVDVGNETSYVSQDHVKISFQLETALKVDETLNGLSAKRSGIIQYAKQFLGNPYVWGGTSLTKGIDCSAYVQAIYKKYGYSLPRTSREQVNCGKAIKESQLQIGDLVFYAKNGRVCHVAMYLGKVDGKQRIIHAANPRKGISMANMKYTTPYRYVNIIGD